MSNRIGWISVLAALIVGTSCAPSTPVIKVEPSASSLQVNHLARVSVIVENIVDLTAFEVHLSFDPDTLEVVELNSGGFITPDFTLQDTFDNDAGTIDYAIAQIDRPSANGSGKVFEIVFRAKAEGNSLIHFRETPAAPMGALFSDDYGTELRVSLMNGSMNVHDS